MSRATFSKRTYWKSDNGKYEIHFTDAGIRVDNNALLVCDWPMMRGDGKIIYDHPERFAGYVKSKMYDAFEAYRKWRTS